MTYEKKKQNFKIEKMTKTPLEFSPPPPKIFPNREPEPKVFKKTCRYCGGDLTEKFLLEYDHRTGWPFPILDTRQQSHFVRSGYYCLQCGIKYEFVPEKKKK
jgi:hypothetical protein